MALSQDNAAWFADTFTRIVDNVGQALLGKEDVVRLALTTSSPPTCCRATSRA